MFDISSATLVLLILIASVVLFISEKVRADLVAMLVLASLLVFGLVPQDQILSGFSSSATITIAAMYIISAGLQRTGIVRWVAGKLHSMVGQGRDRLNIVLMSVCGVSSAFTSNTATVAVLLPVSLRLALERHMSPSRILMPLSYAAQFGGICTLIGTSTNLLVNAVGVDHGLEPLSMFEFTKLGVICFAVGLVYMLFASRFLLSDRAKEEDVTTEYRLQDYLTEMKVLTGSPLIGEKGGENELTEMNLRILEIIRDGKMIWAPQVTEIREDDILLIRGDAGAVMEVEGRLKMEDWAEGNLSDVHLKSDDITLMEVMIPHSSHVIGRTLTQLDFYWRYHAAVLAVRRRGEIIHERMSNIVLAEGDTLLLQGHKEDLNHLSDERDFVLLQDLSTLRLRRQRAFMALAILLFVIVSSSFGFLSVLGAAILGAILMVVTKCLQANEVYSSINMHIIVLLAGLIPLGYAMENSGLANTWVEYLMGTVGSYGPVASLAVIYTLTMVLTALMSNAATAVLLTPIAIAVAESFHVNPQPFLMAVAFAASTCFATPVGYQTNLMVYGPGGYKYVDFLKVGLPLNLIFLCISVTLIPLIWPF